MEASCFGLHSEQVDLYHHCFACSATLWRPFGFCFFWFFLLTDVSRMLIRFFDVVFFLSNQMKTNIHTQTHVFSLQLRCKLHLFVEIVFFMQRCRTALTPGLGLKHVATKQYGMKELTFIIPFLIWTQNDMTMHWQNAFDWLGLIRWAFNRFARRQTRPFWLHYEFNLISNAAEGSATTTTWLLIL